MIGSIMDVIIFFLYKNFFSYSDVTIIHTILNDIIKLATIYLTI